MAFDFSTLFWIFLAIMVLQPLFTGRWYALRRAQAIRAPRQSGYAARSIGVDEALPTAGSAIGHRALANRHPETAPSVTVIRRFFRGAA